MAQKKDRIAAVSPKSDPCLIRQRQRQSSASCANRAKHRGQRRRIGNTPKIIEGTRFLPRHRQPSPFTLLVEKIKDGKLPGKQIDWGAWAANLAKTYLVAFIDEAYEGARNFFVEKLLAFVDALPNDERYAPVACDL